MEPESDDEEQINLNTFIVLDSQRPPMLEEGENQAAREREAECHEAILKNLEISRASCPETPAHLQGSEARQKCQEHELKLDLRATDLNVSHEITTKSPTSFSSSSSSSGTASGQLCSLSIHSLNSSTSDGDAKSPMFGISTQNVALSGAESKSGSSSSSSSTYPQSSSSSHRSQDTQSIPSSPEFRKPVGTALHRANTSSSSSGSPTSDAKTRPSSMQSSGEEGMLVAPPKKPKLEDQDSPTEFSNPEKQSQEHSDPQKRGQEQHSSSESISFQKTDSQHHSTPTELSSRDVTHIDTPQMKSTPADGSFECLQLSGDVAKSVSSVYSLPDPLPSSPSLSSISSGSSRLVSGIFSEPDVSLSSGFSGSEETRNQSKMQKMVRGKPGVGSTLPKWVREIVREKKLEKKIHFSSSSDSTHKSGSSSPGSSTSEDRSPPHRPIAIRSKHVESKVPEQRPDKAAKESQEKMSCEDFEESCVYPIQDVAVSSKSSAGSEEVGPDDKQNTTEPQTKGSPEVEKADQGIQTEATKHLFGDMEIEMSQDLFNLPLTASETTRSSQPSDKDRLLMLEENANVSKLGSFGEHDKPASASDVDIELNLFLSQTQPGPNQAQHLPSQVQLDQSHTMKSNETSSDVRSSLLEDRDSNGTVKTTPSQSIINNNSKNVAAASQTSIYTGKEGEMTGRSTTEKETEEQQRLNIPKDVIERVVAADTATESSLNKFHFTLPPEGEPIHPQRTITPPVGRTAEDIEQTEDSSQRVQTLAVNDKKDETASLANTQDSVKSIATEQRSESMLEPERPTSEEDEESIDIPKIVGFPPAKIDEDRVKNIDDNQVESETIYAKALKVGRGLAKRDVHSTSPDTDPFAFSDRDKQDSGPKKKRRKLAELPQPQPSTSKEIPKPNLPVSTQEEKSAGEISERIEGGSSDGEAYCLSVTEIIEKVETRTQRMMVTKYHSLKTGKVLKTIEEAEPEQKTVSKKCLTSTEVIVPTESLDVDTKTDDKKGKKSPRKGTPKQPCRTSPRVQKRKRSSSSTPPGDVSAVPKERPNQKGKPKDTPVRSSEVRKSRDKANQSKDESKKSKKKTKKAKPNKNSKRSKDEKALKSKEKRGDPDVKPGRPDEEKTEYEKLLELEWESMRRKTRNTRTAVEESAAQNAPRQLKTHSRGFGRWTDGRYYPGKITLKADNGRYKMKFDDGRSLLLIPSSCVTLDVLPVGQRLFAYERDEACFNIATVVAVHKNKHGKSPNYDVQFDRNEQVKRVKTADLMLDSKQIEEFIETGPEYMSGDDQPIDASKSQSCLKLDINKNKTPKERKYEMRMKRAEEIVVGSHDLSSPTSEEQQPEENPWRRKRNILRKSPDGFDIDANSAAAILDEKKYSVTRKRDKMENIEELKKNQDDPDFIKLYGPLPSNKNLFRGYAFLITHSTPKEMDDQIRTRCEGFKRPYIACQIVAGGGTVVYSIKELLDVPPDTIILIAPMAQTTVKYYFALSNGVPCLSHTWLQRCCKENKLVEKEEYLLEAGCDYISGEMIMAPKDTRVFAGRKIFLQIASSSKCKKEELALAVTFAGGKIISKLPKLKRDNALDDDDDDQHCDFILVGDNITLNRSVMARAGALGIPCVTQRYFNQCVTHGEILDPSIYTFKYESPKKS